MKLGIVVTDADYLPIATGLIDAARAREWETKCFLTDTGVMLLADAGFVERAQARPNSVALCEHSAKKYAGGAFDISALADRIVVGGQTQNAELARLCDKVLVF